MKQEISYPRHNLLQALQTVSSVADTKFAKPVLSTVLVNLSPRECSFTCASDFIRMTTNFPGHPYDEVLRFATDARRLYDLIKTLPENSSIGFSVEENFNVILTCGRSRFSLKGINPSEFPHDEESVIFDSSCKITQSGLKDLFNRTSFAMGDQDIRPYLNGLLLETDMDSSSLNAVASDGHRLAWHRCTAIFNEFIRVILPRRTVQELLRHLSDQESEVQIEVGGTRAKFVWQNNVLLSGLLDGNYPEYRSHIPEHAETRAWISLQALGPALNSVSLLADNKFHQTRMIFTSETLRVMTESMEHGAAEIDIDIRFEGKPLDIVYNGRYLQDVIGKIDGDELLLGMTGTSASSIIRSGNLSHPMYVLMPLRV